ncbi:hypothetical protein B0T17DRAFT_508973 [Bombardia bombarda]|uniref:Endonuclease/exonuclease/phosphatase domain-containing protein n=1 Tax=Bombardia bombarda TaxID=252184 RepID=A0AA39WU50_9PEZI|nr:hypothetical protein B0T17DRAFT_508973 [Bombardia bombarda]
MVNCPRPPLVKRRKLAEETDTAVPSHNDSTNPLNTIRTFSWKINGIEPFLPEPSAKITTFFKPANSGQNNSSPPQLKTHTSLRAFLLRHGWPEVLLLQELKIRQGDSKTLASLLSSLNTPLNPSDITTDNRTYTLHTQIPRDRHNARGNNGKLYGVGTILRTDFAQNHVSRIRDAGWDLEGRVSIVELKPPSPSSSIQIPTTPCKPLALLNIYAVNGTSGPYRSPQSGLAAGTRHDHKIAFHSRLRDECFALQSRGFDAVVAGDLNVARELLDGHPNLRTFPRQHCINRADFNRKFFNQEDNKRARAYVNSDKQSEFKSEGDGSSSSDVSRCLDAVDVLMGKQL